MPTDNGSADLDRLRRRKSRSDSSNGLLSDSVSGNGTSPSDDTGAPADEDAQGTANLAGDTGGERGGVEAFRPSVPAHRRVRESSLSSDAIFQQSHAGLFNLCLVLLIAVNGRLSIENLMTYGLLITPDFWFTSTSLRDWPLFMCCLSLPIFPLASFIVEQMVLQKHISETVVIILHIIITMSEVLYPVYVTLRCDSTFLSGNTLMLITCIVWLKLVSYAHTNYDMRALANSADDKANPEVSYYANLKSFAYFMVAPTLCYQPSYPRSPCIRKGWVARQFAKQVIFTGLIGCMTEQYINPIVRNSKHPLNGDLLYAIERMLKLSVPIVYVWLCWFYCFFHLWLNILAELLRFGDREFYKDWWNAKSVGEYWRMWNMPAHKWMARHVYFPCLRRKIPKVRYILVICNDRDYFMCFITLTLLSFFFQGSAMIISFFVSAVFHELLIGVPCRVFRLWAFMGIMFQVPLVFITNYLQERFGSMVGNMFFWFVFCILGQPMCVILYYHDMMNSKGSMS
uniref:O-acyltransferase n=1 Tax=Orychophragmus violaceus TaxID=71234 RepID=A0A977XCW7_ORYVI|nr:DGAT1-1 [Orychophragmus violaceus]